ncbi:MAG: SpoIVB peptidase [Oscillospiraceae bacterium]|nr:SpoIVB peptidase [Oscillospiraceae bacterium]
MTSEFLRIGKHMEINFMRRERTKAGRAEEATKKARHLTAKKAAASLTAFALLTGAGVYSLAAEAKELIPVGRAVGIRISTDGVVVVGVPDKCKDDKTDSPAKKAGFRAGDTIIKIGGTEIKSAQCLRGASEKFDGKPVQVTVRRDGHDMQLAVTPARGNDGYSLGLYVRDGLSGIGTVTFYDPETGLYGALGHSISDSETGAKLTVRAGEIGHASVRDVQKGAGGAPGQLHGEFDFDNKLGTITGNTDSGIFGKLDAEDAPNGKAIETAETREIHTGKAYILANVSGTKVEKYDCEISRVYSGREAEGRNMLITICDGTLCDKTGGIVQGMSGSPIIQDGKLVGAVTHVLLGEPTKGYGISIEKMLASAEAAAGEKSSWPPAENPAEKGSLLDRVKDMLRIAA